MVIEKSAFLGGDTFNFGNFFFSPGFILMVHTFFKCQNPGTPNLAKWSINDMRSKTKLVLEQILTTIARVADTVEEKFVEYYEEAGFA